MKAIIVDSGATAIDSAMRNEMLEWARTIGIDTKTATARFLLIEHPDGWHGHFGVKRQRNGHDYIVPGTNRVDADYDVDIPLGERSWPGWFGEPVDLPDISARQVLEVLLAADEAKVQIGGEAFRRREAAPW